MTVTEFLDLILPRDFTGRVWFDAAYTEWRLTRTSCEWRNMHSPGWQAVDDPAVVSHAIPSQDLRELASRLGMIIDPDHPAFYVAAITQTAHPEAVAQRRVVLPALVESYNRERFREDQADTAFAQAWDQVALPAPPAGQADVISKTRQGQTVHYFVGPVQSSITEAERDFARWKEEPRLRERIDLATAEMLSIWPGLLTGAISPENSVSRLYRILTGRES